ncbi:MAG: trehalose utilization, partial [Caulobacteraceae bacterium]|nr:trehalose utilization [Caulobacteraceae bacterium]
MKSNLLAAMAALLMAGSGIGNAMAAAAAKAPAKATPKAEVSDHGIPLTPKGVVPGGPMNQNLGDMDYGVCRGVDPACFHAWAAPKITPTTQFRVLLFTHTAGPRHANLGTAFAAGAGLNPPLVANNVVQAQMKRLAAENGFALDYTEDPAQLSNLSRYNAVIFFSTSRDALDDGAQTALRQFMRSGGGFVAIHNAFGTEYNWPYYEGLLGGANYYDHGAERNGDVVIVDKYDSSTKALPAKFGFRDEWYNLVPFPTHVRFLATVDEKSLTAVP